MDDSFLKIAVSDQLSAFSKKIFRCKLIAER